jgi:hypothetical protein
MGHGISFQEATTSVVGFVVTDCSNMRSNALPSCRVMLGTKREYAQISISVAACPICFAIQLNGVDLILLIVLCSGCLIIAM